MKMNFFTTNINMMRDLTIKQLRAIAKERWLKGYSKLKKADLIELVRENQSFEISKSESVLKKFTTQYTIAGINGYDPTSFLIGVKQNVINLLESNHQTKVKMVLLCIMERTEITTGKIIIRDAPFYTEQEVNLEGNNLDEMYVKMKDTIIERMTNFMKLGSGWRFRSIVKLVVHVNILL